MQLFKELQRRNVFRVAIGYILSSWLLAQVADLVLDNINAPEWVMQTILLVLALGFPVVVFFSWAYEVTPEGIKRESEVDHSESTVRLTARKLDRAIIAVLIAALAYFVWESRFADDGSARGHATGQETSQTDVMATEPETSKPDRAEGQAIFNENSIAVLPFVNMSSDQEQEYFSDGLSEELLNLLARNPNLRVAARTSSFSFKGQKLEISEIAERLHVSHVLEGSVRKSDNRIRITAQLIQARDGYHLWSETYDRTLEDIFGLQDEIAGKIITALLPQIIENSDSNDATANLHTYRYTPSPGVFQDYLLARNYFNKQTESGRSKALELMTPLVRENPDYADAQAFYALVVFSSSARTGGDVPWILAEAQSRKAIDKSLALNPAVAEAYLVKGLLSERSRDVKSAIAFYEKAIERNPSYSDAYVSLAEASMLVGQRDRGWEALAIARTLDPVSLLVLSTAARIATQLDRPEMADEAMAVLRQIEPETASELEVRLLQSQHEIARAARQLERHIAQFPDGPPWHRSRLAGFYGSLGMRDKARELSAEAEMIMAAQDGQREHALDLAEKLAAPKTDPHDRADVYWMTYYALGSYDEARSVLEDLWYGYAEEHMGPRMDVFDCEIFAQLLVRAGRSEEAKPIMKVLWEEVPIGMQVERNRHMEAFLSMIEGKQDTAIQLLHENADQGYFPDEYDRPYFFFRDLEQHAGYPALIEKYEIWQENQRELYQAIGAQDLN